MRVEDVRYLVVLLLRKNKADGVGMFRWEIVCGMISGTWGFNKIF